MKKRNRFLSWLLFFAIMVTTFVVPTETPQAEVIAGGYDTGDPKGFYEKLEASPYDALFANGQIYFATRAKLATNPNNTRYKTIGYTIKVTNGSHTLHLTVDADGGAYFKNIKSSTYNGVEYTLRGITYDNIVTLCRNQVGENAASFQSIFSSSYITITLDAIVTIIKKGEDKGGITAEDGKGGVTPWGVRYYLNNSSDLAKLRDYGFSNDFESYMNIKSEVPNNNLTLTYYADTKANASKTTATVGSGYSIAANGKINGLSTSDTAVRQFQSLTIKTASSLGLKKTGYYLKSGEEWKNDSGKAFKAGSSYMASQINWAVTTGTASANFYANWKPIAYTVYYNANGGSGSISPSTMTYDATSNLRKNTLTRVGYRLVEGKEWKDANGNTYASGQSVKNLLSTNGAQLTLYANWEPCVYKITTDKQNGTGGSDYFFEKYSYGFYSNQAATSTITSISVPKQTGYEFLGYYTNMLRAGEPVVNALGKIVAINTFFTRDTTIFANWKAQQHNIIFDKNGGTGGADSVLATYGKLAPAAEGPYKTGYTFMGYYLSEDYLEDDRYYSDNMAPLQMFLSENDVTVHAKWVDDINPEVRLSIKPDSWTNKPTGIIITASAEDKGSGLSKVILYCGDTPVATKDNLNGTTEKVIIEHAHTKEGVYQYQVVAYDIDGNVIDTYGICKYDVTKPNGTYDVESDDPYNFSINVDAWDYIINP